MRRRQVRRVVEGGARERKHTRTQHGEATACRRVHQRVSLQEGGKEREGGQGGEGNATRDLRHADDAAHGPGGGDVPPHLPHAANPHPAH